MGGSSLVGRPLGNTSSGCLWMLVLHGLFFKMVSDPRCRGFSIKHLEDTLNTHTELTLSMSQTASVFWVIVILVTWWPDMSTLSSSRQPKQGGREHSQRKHQELRKDSESKDSQSHQRRRIECTEISIIDNVAYFMKYIHCQCHWCCQRHEYKSIRYYNRSLIRRINIINVIKHVPMSLYWCKHSVNDIILTLNVP